MDNNFKLTATVMNTSEFSPYWSNNQAMWIQIPKNANMATRRLCEDHHITRGPRPTSIPPTVFAVWQDPHTRLIRALGEFKRRKNKAESLNELVTQFIVSPTYFDEHFEPQCYYVGDVTVTHPILFEDLRAGLSQLRLFNDQKINQRIKNTSHSRVTDIEQFLKVNHTRIQYAVNKYYRLDLEIYQDLKANLKHVEPFGKTSNQAPPSWYKLNVYDYDNVYASLTH